MLLMGQVIPTEQPGQIQNEREFKLRVFNLISEFNKGIDIGVSTQTNSNPGANTYTGNLNGQWINVTAPGVANTQFAVTHSLTDGQGNPKIPSFYWYISDRSANVYQLPNTGTAWTKTQVFLKCDVASAVLRIFVI
jgi:hypothetical protein